MAFWDTIAVEAGQAVQHGADMKRVFLVPGEISREQLAAVVERVRQSLDIQSRQAEIEKIRRALAEVTPEEPAEDATQ